MNILHAAECPELNESSPLHLHTLLL